MLASVWSSNMSYGHLKILHGSDLLLYLSLFPCSWETLYDALLQLGKRMLYDYKASWTVFSVHSLKVGPSFQCWHSLSLITFPSINLSVNLLSAAHKTQLSASPFLCEKSVSVSEQKRPAKASLKRIYGLPAYSFSYSHNLKQTCLSVSVLLFVLAELRLCTHVCCDASV